MTIQATVAPCTHGRLGGRGGIGSPAPAGVVELVDTPALGAGGRKPLEVRVLSPAFVVVMTTIPAVKRHASDVRSLGSVGDARWSSKRGRLTRDTSHARTQEGAAWSAGSERSTSASARPPVPRASARAPRHLVAKRRELGAASRNRGARIRGYALAVCVRRRAYCRGGRAAASLQSRGSSVLRSRHRMPVRGHRHGARVHPGTGDL